MAKCDICGKGVHFGNNVSHSHRRSNRIFHSNVKRVKCVNVYHVLRIEAYVKHDDPPVIK